MKDSKICAQCGRPFDWRKKWEKCWDEVKYCSERCRRAKKQNDNGTLEAAILDMLSKRRMDSSICPSEVARDRFPDLWRDHMEEVRQAGRRLAGKGMIEVTQGGKAVDAAMVKGPIRYRLKR